MPLVRPFAAALILAAGAVLAGPTRAAWPSATTETVCMDLAAVTYYAGSAPLSKQDRRHLAEAKKDARTANKLRPAIDAALIEQAESRGAISHGNHGEGLTNVDEARGDGLTAALYVHQECLSSGGAELN